MRSIAAQTDSCASLSFFARRTPLALFLDDLHCAGTRPIELLDTWVLTLSAEKKKKKALLLIGAMR